MSDPETPPDDNPFLRRQNRTKNLTNSHKRSKRQEKEIEKRHGAKRVPGSGVGFVKGDNRIKGVLRIEAKTTKNSSFSVTLEMIDKIETAAALSAELPVIIVEFNDGFGKKIKEVAVVPTYVLDSIPRG